MFSIFLVVLAAASASVMKTFPTRQHACGLRQIHRYPPMTIEYFHAFNDSPLSPFLHLSARSSCCCRCCCYGDQHIANAENHVRAVPELLLYCFLPITIECVPPRLQRWPTIPVSPPTISARSRSCRCCYSCCCREQHILTPPPPRKKTQNRSSTTPRHVCTKPSASSCRQCCATRSRARSSRPPQPQLLPRTETGRTGP